MTNDPHAQSERAALPIAALDDPFDPSRAGDVLLALVERAGGRASVVHPGGPVGLVDIDADVCTGCGTCAASCPTGALSVRDETERTSLWFDAGACPACGTCVARCPEAGRGAIRLTRTVDTDRLSGGSTPLWDGDVARCSACGAPIATAALLGRFAAHLQDEQLAAALSERCPDCRSGWQPTRRTTRELTEA